MDKGAQMPEMQPAPEKMEGLQVIPFGELEETMKDQILSLEFNALDTGKKRNFEARKQSLKDEKLWNEHLKSEAHGDVLVAVHDEHVIGVLTLNRENGVGIIDDIWLRGEHHQDAVISELLTAAKEDLRNGAVRCDSALLQAQHPSADLRRVYHHVLDIDSRMFFTLEAKDN